MTYSIDLYAFDGSPLNIHPGDIWTRGVGGAELAMMTWAETMAKRGHTVRVYNNPNKPGLHSGVLYLPQREFDPAQYRDVFIAFRSPNPHTRQAKAAVKLFWSTDQYTTGNYATDIFPFVDRVVCISPYHVDYHKVTYGVEAGKIGYFDLGVRVEDYEQDIAKVPGRCIFCSVPDRGLPILRRCWPEIKEQAPEASLVITADYTLWGSPTPNNHQHRLDWVREQDVEFVGNIPRKQLVQEQLKAVCQPFPCTYNELFCISAAECQVAGAMPLTSTAGALQTTNQWGWQLDGNPADRWWQRKFINVLAAALVIEDKKRQQMQEQARKRFDWSVICGKWERLIESGEFS